MIDEDLTNMEDWLRRLKVEYHIFFNGGRKKPPDDLKLRLEHLVKKLSESSEMTFSQRFRYNTLVTRFYVFRDLWRRTQQNLEIGAEPKIETISKLGDPPATSRASTESVSISIADPKTEDEKVRMLYDKLLQIRGSRVKETPPSYQQFAKYIATQTQGIRQKYGCTKVAFTIALEEDAIRFTATAENR